MTASPEALDLLRNLSGGSTPGDWENDLVKIDAALAKAKADGVLSASDQLATWLTDFATGLRDGADEHRAAEVRGGESDGE